jgi:hypothetical protein
MTYLETHCQHTYFLIKLFSVSSAHAISTRKAVRRIYRMVSNWDVGVAQSWLLLAAAAPGPMRATTRARCAPLLPPVPLRSTGREHSVPLLPLPHQGPARAVCPRPPEGHSPRAHAVPHCFPRSPLVKPAPSTACRAAIAPPRAGTGGRSLPLLSPAP